MSSPISVFIEMPVYLQKYLTAISINKKQPLQFRNKHDYNRLLINIVSNRTDIKPPDYNKPGIKILLPFSKIKDIYFYNKISTENRELFRKTVKADLLYDFRLFIKEMIRIGINRKDALELFFLSLNITEDDIKYESFYRQYTRYNKKRNITNLLTALTDLKPEIVNKIQALI